MGLSRAGFTLIELMVVMLVIGLISAVAMPKLIPLIAFSELEGSARHLSNYGRAAVAQAAFSHERHVIRFDLDAEPQSYYLVHWVVPEDEEDSGAAGAGLFSGEEEDSPFAGMADALPGLSKSLGTIEEEDVENRLLLRGRDPGLLTPEEFEAEKMNMAVDDQFDGFHRRALEVRAANVILPDGFMEETELFEGEFELDETEPVEEEVVGPILRRSFLPRGVTIETIAVDGEARSRGEVEIELSALGLAQYVGFHLVNENEEYYTVIWDPFSGIMGWQAGKEDIR